MDRDVIEPGAVPQFSVIIPTHAGRRSLRATVEALLSQGGDDLEVIVVADGDGRTTYEVVSDVDDPRLRVFEKAAEGANSARNHGLTHARFTWIAFVDDDDVPRGNWLSTWHAAIDGSTLVATAGLALWREGSLESVKQCRLDVGDPTMAASTLMAGAFVVRRDLLEFVGGYDTALRFAENQDLGLRMIDVIRSGPIEGGTVVSDAVVLDVFVEPAAVRSRRHGDAQADSVRLLLRRYEDRVAADRGAREAYSRILSRSSRRRGELGPALRHAMVALRCNPRNPQNLRTLVAAPLAVARRLTRRPAR